MGHLISHFRFGLRLLFKRPGFTAISVLMLALISRRLWQDRFAQQLSVLGQTLRLDNQPYTIIGVLPEEARFPGDADVWVPLGARVDEQRGWYLRGVGRIKPGISLEMARQDLTQIHRNIEHRQVNSISSPRLTWLRERYLGDFRLANSILPRCNWLLYNASPDWLAQLGRFFFGLEIGRFLHYGLVPVCADLRSRAGPTSQTRPDLLLAAR